MNAINKDHNGNNNNKKKKKKKNKSNNSKFFLADFNWLMILLWPPGSVGASPGGYNTRNYISMYWNKLKT